MNEHRRSARIEKLPPYLFGRLNDQKLKMRQEGIDIIDFGMGNPNIPTSQFIVNKLKEVIEDPKTHRYSASRGIRICARRSAAATRLSMMSTWRGKPKLSHFWDRKRVCLT